MVLADSQSILPQAQASELHAADPSVKVQGECLLHRFSDCLQNMPVVLADSQSTLPQAQAAGLAEDPLTRALSDRILRHWLLAQLAVHPVVLADRNPFCRKHTSKRAGAQPSKYSSCFCIGFLTACKHASGAGRLAIHTAASTGFRVG